MLFACTQLERSRFYFKRLWTKLVLQTVSTHNFPQHLALTLGGKNFNSAFLSSQLNIPFCLQQMLDEAMQDKA